MAYIENVCMRDIPQIVVVQDACFHEKTPQIFEKELASTAIKYWCAKEDDEVVGYICISIIEDEAELHSIAVHPAHQNKGIGQQLLTHALHFAQKNNAKKMFLEVCEDNFIAQRLYKANGFLHKYTRKNYYGTKDAYILEKTFV